MSELRDRVLAALTPEYVSSMTLHYRTGLSPQACAGHCRYLVQIGAARRIDKCCYGPRGGKYAVPCWALRP